MQALLMLLRQRLSAAAVPWAVPGRWVGWAVWHVITAGAAWCQPRGTSRCLRSSHTDARPSCAWFGCGATWDEVCAPNSAQDPSESNVQPFVRVLSAPQILPPEAILQCGLLALWQAGDAVSAVDLTRWALGGRLPLLALPHACASLLAGATPDFPLPLLQPAGETRPGVRSSTFVT